MIFINTEKAFKNVENLTKKYNSTQILIDSLEIIKINKSNCFRKIVFICIEVMISIVMAHQVNTISLTKEVFEIVVSVVIALLAIVFTGYAFFQALINKKMLITLLSVDDNQGGNLSQTNKYFAEVMIFQMACLLLDLAIVIFAIIVPQEWILLKNNMINEMIAVFGLFIGLYFNVESIWEMKSFIFNVFQLFNLHAYSRMAEINDEEKKH